MDNLNSNDKIIFRLPDSKTIEFIESGVGEDSFILQAFDKGIEPKEIKGTLRSIETQEIEQLIGRFKLTDNSDKSSIDFKSYNEIIHLAQEQMLEGVFKKVVLAGKFWKEGEPNVMGLFNKLLKNYPKAFVYVGMIGPDMYMGASPETLLVKRDNLLFTEALGGTKTNGVYTNKEKIEHHQIIEYIQEILNRKSYKYELGTTESKPAGFIEHLCTNFKIQNHSKSEDIKLAHELHPTSAVCGLPYSESLNFIKKFEKLERQYYSGFLGPVPKKGDFSFYVNLRCAKIYNSGLLFFAGAGINSLSNPKDEWDEINNKVNTIAQFLE
ncbi:MAG: chorismate-binding protein [Bacteroidia bacterium]